MAAVIFVQETGPNTELAWLLYLFLAFFLLMVIIGWWAHRRGRDRADVAEPPPVHDDQENSHDGSMH